MNDKDYNLLMSENFNETVWYFELGRAEQLVSGTEPLEHQFMGSFYDRGVQLWEIHKAKLREILCNPEAKEPKEYIKELIEGDLRNLIETIISLLTTTYSLSISIAIPLAGLALRKGIGALCR